MQSNLETHHYAIDWQYIRLSIDYMPNWLTTIEVAHIAIKTIEPKSLFSGIL